MLRIFISIFIVLHGLVHLLYFGQSMKLFELQPGLLWPEGSWVFSKPFGDQFTRWLANIFCILAAAGFVVGGVAVFIRQGWWRPVAIGSAAFSSLLYILFWNGKMEKLDNQGGIGILINLAIIAAVIVLANLNYEV